MNTVTSRSAAASSAASSSSMTTANKKSVRSQSCQAYPLTSAAKIQTLPVFIQPERPTSRDKKVQTPLAFTAECEKRELISREVQACPKKRNQNVQTDAEEEIGTSTSEAEQVQSVSIIIEREGPPAPTFSQSASHSAEHSSCAFCDQASRASMNIGEKKDSSSVLTQDSSSLLTQGSSSVLTEGSCLVSTIQSSGLGRNRVKSCAQQTDLGGDVKQIVLVEKGEFVDQFLF